MVRIALAACFILLVGLAQEELVGAQDVARLQSGVVKITAKPPQGTTNVGTGFIVRLDNDAAYIVTAAHVVAGDTHPKVEFFTKRNLPVTAEVLGLEGDDEVRGLALVVVRGQENLPKVLTASSLAGATRLTGGEDIVVIGFPRNAGPWAIVKGNISSRQGRDIYFSPPSNPAIPAGRSSRVAKSSAWSVREVNQSVEALRLEVSRTTLRGLGSRPKKARVRHLQLPNPHPRQFQQPNRSQVP